MYSNERRLEGVTLAEARARVTEALAAQGFGILTEVDVQATFKAKLNADFRPYVVLGACNPTLAYEALHVEPQIGLLLPCHVVVQEVDGASIVSIINPRVTLGLVGNSALEPVVEQAEQRFQRALDAL